MRANELTVTEYQDIRVLTTQQIAEAYETDTKIISNNFNRNKDRYEEGKHFICLDGEEKRDFINRHQFDDGSKKAGKMYLWTEKGAFLHAKSLNTDKAWEVYDHLVDTYFKAKQAVLELQNLSKEMKAILMHDEKIVKIENRMDKLEFEIPLYGPEADELSAHVKKRAVFLLGGKKSQAYKDRSIRDKLFRTIYTQLKMEFDVYDVEGKLKAYKNMKRKYLKQAHEYVETYEPPFYLKEMIDDANAQQEFSFT